MNTPSPVPAEWFNDARFWEYGAPVMFDEPHWREVPVVADNVTRLAGLPLYDAVDSAAGDAASDAGFGAELNAPRVLDMCCGFGRITLELARRGFQATGVDITASYLAAARDDAAYEGLTIEFVEDDARRFCRPQWFDLAVNLYISFGYCADPGDDRRIGENLYTSLKPGGTCIIETMGKEIAVRDFVQREWFTRGGLTVLTEYAPVDGWAGLQNRWILVPQTLPDQTPPRPIYEKTFVQRLYAATELRQLLYDVGFESVDLYGDWNDEPYDQYARSLIAVARKSRRYT